MVECPVEDSLAVSKAIHEDLVAHFSPDFYEDSSGFCYRQTAPNGGEPVSHRISFYGPIIVRPFCTDSIPLCPAFCLSRPFLSTASTWGVFGTATMR